MRKSGSHGLQTNNRMTIANIKRIFDERIENVKNLATMTAAEMLRDFRNVQYSSPKLDTPTKAQSANVIDTNVQKAINFAKAHKGKSQAGRGTPWLNRSLRAARTVNAGIEITSNSITIRMSHGAYYGAYLEYAHNRKYAILEPLVRKYFIIFYKNLKHAMGGGKF